MKLYEEKGEERQDKNKVRLASSVVKKNISKVPQKTLTLNYEYI